MIYLPMIPEAVIAMLACARIGAPHSVVFSGFSAEALKERVNDCGAKVIITSDGGFRRGTALAIKRNVDEALLGAPKVKSVLVVQRTKQEVTMTPGRDFWLHEETAAGQRRLQGRAVRQRASPLHPLHQRQHGQTEGHPPHHGGLPARLPPDDEVRTSICGPRTSTSARPTSAGSPATATSPTASFPTAAPASSTRARRTIPSRTASGGSSTGTR
jgi:acyl-CoA synthetase (AMP-forming)/AMP-acid ligase II